jgi:beta-lactamase regulating signal transducer with metallopeptidase domain
MSGLLMLRALLFAGECFLASLLLPLLAFAVTALLRRRAALRHLVWTTMFGVLAVLPFVALLLPPRRIVEHVAAPVAAALPVAAPVMAVPPPSLFTLENGVLLLVALWLAGLCWQLARLGLGTFGLMRLRHASAAFASEIETGCAVRLAAGEDGPSTFGILRPLILLPRSARAWPVARMEAVLRHEAAHVARRDVASQFLARLVCALYWLNPLLWHRDGSHLGAVERAVPIAKRMGTIVLD